MFEGLLNRKGVTDCCLSPINFTGLLQSSCGRMSWGRDPRAAGWWRAGRPLMPMLLALGQHSALVAISERLQEGELLFAFHDDLYVKSSPNRAVECSHILRQELWCRCRISLNNGKTRLWNRAGLFPQGCEVVEDAARRDDPEAVVWKGNPELPLSQQGIKILGIPVGKKEFVEHTHAELLEKIPRVKDLQCAWSILLYCGVSRANFFIRAVSPDHSLQFARDTRSKSGVASPL